jgi:hypothetical protein
MVKPLSRIVGFGPLILRIPILVGEIKPHLHYCGSKQNTFVWLQSSSIPSFWPKKKNILLWFLVNEVKSTCFQTWVKIFSVAETKMDQKKAQVNIAIPLPRTSHRMHRPGAAFATSSAIRATCSSERAISSATCSGRPTWSYRGGSSDFRRFFRFTKNPEFTEFTYL